MIDLLQRMIEETSYLGTEAETYVSQNRAFALIEDLYNSEDSDDVPTGTIRPFVKEPDIGVWLLCDGATYDEVLYPDLWLYLSTTPFVTDPDEFDVPDLVGNVIVGGDDITWDVGDVGGDETHTLTEDEMPDHTHETPYKQNAQSGTDRSKVQSWAGRTGELEIGHTGGDQPHNNMQPYLVLLWYIKS